MSLTQQTIPKIARVVAWPALAGADVSDKPAGKRVSAAQAERVPVEADCLRSMQMRVEKEAWRDRGIDDGVTRRFKADMHTGNLSEAVISGSPGSG